MHSGVAGIAGRNKPLINMKAHLQRCAFCFAFIWFQGSRFKVQGSRGGFAAFFIGRCPKVVFKSRVTSHNNDTSRPLETEVPQRDFRVWPNPKRRLACPLRRLPVRPNGPRRRRRMDPRSGVKNYVRLSVFHLSSRPKWRDLSCRAVNRERGKGEKGSTKVSFERGRMCAYGSSAIKIPRLRSG